MVGLRSRAGMTLIELIVVLAIIGITLGVSSVAIGAMADRLSSSDEEVEQLFGRARGLAARRAEPVRVRFLAGARFEVVALDSLRVLEQGSLAGSQVSPTPTAVTFFPAGTASGGSLCLRLGANWEHLAIDQVTGGPVRTGCAECCPTR